MGSLRGREGIQKGEKKEQAGVRGTGGGKCTTEKKSAPAVASTRSTDQRLGRPHSVTAVAATPLYNLCCAVQCILLLCILAITKPKLNAWRYSAHLR